MKSTTRTSDTYVAGAGIQRYVARGAWLSIRDTFVMHRNQECRYPDLSNLFDLDEVAKFNELIRQPSAPAVPIGKQPAEEVRNRHLIFDRPGYLLESLQEVGCVRFPEVVLLQT